MVDLLKTKKQLIKELERLRERTAELEALSSTCGTMNPATRNTNCKLSALIENLPGMGYACLNDDNWTMQYVSKGCKELTGYMPEDLICNNRISYNEIIHPDDRELVWNLVQEAVSKKEKYHLLYRILTLTGQEKWVWEQGLGVFSNKGVLLSLQGFISDVAA